MGYGTDFKIDVYLNRQIFNSKEEVEDKIEEEIDYINSIESKLKMYASSDSFKVVPEDWKDDSIGWLNIQIETLLQDLEETLRKIFKLELYLEYLKENNITNIKQIE